MRVLVACEYSGIVRRAFHEKGHDVMSCDLLPADDGSPYHYQGDVLDFWNQIGKIDLIIAHPPCTHLAVSGAAWFKQKQADGRQQEAVEFFMKMINAPAEKVCVENPVCIMSRLYRKPDQIINPWQFGQSVNKKTCLWLKNLPPLVPTNIVAQEEYVTYASGKRSPMWHAKTGGGCGHKRSLFFEGIAKAMADQWG